MCQTLRQDGHAQHLLPPLCRPLVKFLEGGQVTLSCPHWSDLKVCGRPASPSPSPSLRLQQHTHTDAAHSPAPHRPGRNMGSAGHLCSVLLVVFLLGLHHSSGFWIINVVFPPNAKPRASSNSTPPLIIGKCYLLKPTIQRALCSFTEDT